MFVYVRYGFGEFCISNGFDTLQVPIYIETIPAKKYNINVPCPILLSFIKVAYICDVEEYCRHRIVQLSIDLDSALKVLQTRGLAAIQSVKEDTVGNPRKKKVKNRSKIKSTAVKDCPEMPPSQTEAVEDEFELGSARARKEEVERQLAIIHTANKYVKGC